MTRPVTPDSLATRALSLTSRAMREWAANPGSAPVLDIPLKPPTERDVLADPAATKAWIDAWRALEANSPVTVTWGSRQWARVGTQTLPQRARVEGADAIAAVAGVSPEWEVMRSRCTVLRVELAPLARVPDGLTAALKRHAGTVATLPASDFAVLAGVVEWLATNPASGRRVRELPIRGIDTKWLERHRTLVEDLVSAVTGRDSLGLIAAPHLVRVRALDPTLHIGGLSDVTATIEELAALPLRPQTVLVTENLETLLALPPLAGVIGIHGAGYRVHEIAGLTWLRSSRILYWGDLDSHGFAILNRARSAGLHLESVLMDTATLMSHRDLWVPEPSPFTGQIPALTAEESDVVTLLAAEGHVRLEQERIPWAFALDGLHGALNCSSPAADRGGL